MKLAKISASGYLARKQKFNRLRRTAKLSFDALYRLFASDLTSPEIARRAGVSRPRINRIFDDYFADLFGMSAFERRKAREGKIRQRRTQQIARAIAGDSILNAIWNSARKVGSKRKIVPILTMRRGSNPSKRFRHRAVLVDGRPEQVHHLRSERIWPRGGGVYAVTSVSRRELEGSTHTIFYIEVPGHRRRVLRSNSARLLRALFPRGANRRNVYIPLDRPPSEPVYDFLADENNWR
jgi:AraC-like DNA-binding protein